tara:strand:+ start:853 stop:1176 length:324 start_codon:yes stop_codon:yes gene_type:complete
MSKKKPYYPNNWRAFKDAPDQFFISLPFDEFMDWKVGGWEIPSSICCIIREEDEETGKIKEHVYKRAGAAKAKARELMEKNNVFLVCTNDQIHFMKPEEEEYYDEEY